MSPVRVTMRRTIGMARCLYSTALVRSGFIAACAALFAFNLDASEGGQAKLSSIWAVSVSPMLSALCALLGMDAWSDEKKSGRIDILLSSPVKERDYVIGKFLGVWTMSVVSIAVFLAASLSCVRAFAPRMLDGMTLMGFIPGFLALAVQSALWSATAVACSALMRNAAAAATLSIGILVALPRGIWFALSSWSPVGRSSFGSFPVDEQAFDFATGLVSTGMLVSYAVLTWFALFTASKLIMEARFPGRASAGMRLSSRFSIFLAAAFAALSVTLAHRLDATLDLPVGGTGDTHFSARTRNVLAEARGSITVTLFLERKNPSFRELGHFMRSFARQAESVGGVSLELKYVDPTLDIGEAQRLVRAGVEKGSLVFERNGRIADTIRLADGWGERVFASIIERIATPFRRSSVYWTSGHGESSPFDYGTEGMSDIARDLAIGGYVNKIVDLSQGEPLNDDCAMIVVAGARNDFSAAEMDRLRAYLNGHSVAGEGGRLLVLTDVPDAGSISTMLAEWGIRVKQARLESPRTISGTDVIADGFSANHPVSRPFAGQQAVLEHPVSFTPSSKADEFGTGADRIRFMELLSCGNACLAACAERGETGSDLALRPTRIIAVGDVGFVLNGHLRQLANANRDFFMNAVKYLSGRDALTESGTEADRLVSGMDRATRSRFAFYLVAAVPGTIFILSMLLTARRRRRP